MRAALLLALLLMSIQSSEAGRVLREEELLNKDMPFQNFQRGPTSPVGGSGCTYIPVIGGLACPV